MADEFSKGELNGKVIITRDQWQAREPKRITKLNLPIPYVVIHHSYIPPACYNKEQCCKALKQMQDFHMDQRRWSDIAYNFAVGSDGSIYEGRGWIYEGSHSYNFNIVSFGICLIGDWCNSVPPSEQIKAAQDLIAAGVKCGYICKDYKLIGHRQVKVTDCPGDALFEHIKTWGHYSPFPASEADVLAVKEIPDHIRNKIIQNLKK